MEHIFFTRPANVTDAPELLSMQQSLAEYCGYDASKVGITEDLICDVITNEKNARYFIAQTTDENVGMMLANRVPMGWQGNAGIYVEDLFVKPEYRNGYNVGRLLMSRACVAAVQCAGPNPLNAFVRLDTSVEDNDDTLQFYRRLGLQEANVNLRLHGQAVIDLAHWCPSL